MIRLLSFRTLALCALVVLAACSRPKPPDKDRPPEPTAARADSAVGDAIREPIDKAKNVEADLQKAADEQQKAIDAATGG